MAAITSAQSGLASATTTWVGGVVPVVGDKVTVALGHTVTVDGAYTWGDDTSSTTPANNAIFVQGTLKFSRTINSSLTCRGTLFVYDNATLDVGTTADPIPAGVTATLILNDSAAVGAMKHGMTTLARTNFKIAVRGVQRTRNTMLSSATAANASVLPVVASANWGVGDRLVVASDNDDGTRSQVVTITGGSQAAGWSVTPPVTIARPNGTRVGNLSSNVTVKSGPGGGAPSFFSVHSSTSTTQSTVDIGDARFENIGYTGTGWITTSNPNTFSLTFVLPYEVQERIDRLAIEFTSGGSHMAIGVEQPQRFPFIINDCAFYGPVGDYILEMTTGATALVQNCVGYRVNASGTSAFSQGATSVTYVSCDLWCVGNVVNVSNCIGISYVNCFLRVPGGRICSPMGPGALTFDNCYLNAFQMLTSSNYQTGTVILRNCTILGTALSWSWAAGKPQSSMYVQAIANNGNSANNLKYTYYYAAYSDSINRYRSAYSVNLSPKQANIVCSYVFTIPAVAGIAQRIQGYLKFDTTYGVATPPSITLSGQGVAQSFACTASANAWQGFDFAFTPTATGDITVTVTLQSTATTGFAWLDGIYHYPMIQSTRHYGFLPAVTAALTADPRITLDEATALGYGVAVNHTTGTIVISQALTNSQVFHALMADLSQAANLDRAIHVSSTDGQAFSTTYTVSFTGSGAISGGWADAVGQRIAVVAPNLIAGSRVQLYDVTAGAELFNGVLGTGGFSQVVTYVAGHTLRLRADHATKLPLETFNVMSTSGVTFLDTPGSDDVYNGNLIDGSTVTEFTADGPNVQVDISDPDGVTSVQRLYAWAQWYQTTAAGIASGFFGAMVAQDAFNYIVDQARVNLTLDNVSGLPVKIAGGYLVRKDGSTVIASNSGSIQMDPGRAYIAGGIVPSASQNAAAVTAALAPSLTQVDEIHKVHGLNAAAPLVVSDTGRTAGTLTQTIADAAGVVTVTRQ